MTAILSQGFAVRSNYRTQEVLRGSRGVICSRQAPLKLKAGLQEQDLRRGFGRRGETAYGNFIRCVPAGSKSASTRVMRNSSRTCFVRLTTRSSHPDVRAET